MRRVRDMIHADGNGSPLGFQTDTEPMAGVATEAIALAPRAPRLQSNARPVAGPRAALAVFALVLAVHASGATVHADTAPPVAAADAAVQNGLVSRGVGNRPLGWRSEGWSAEAGTIYSWEHAGPGPGALVIRNPKPNDARWIQSVPVEPESWYRISGFVRARGVGDEGIGASLSTLEGFQHSRDLHGEDSGWQWLALFVRTGPGQHRLDVACRLGGYTRTSLGEAACTGIDVTPVAQPPDGAPYTYRGARSRPATGGLPAATAIAALLMLGLLRFTRIPESVPGRERALLWGIVAATLAGKAAIAPRFAYEVDIRTFAAWAMRLAEVGPAGFYETGYFADYPPGYMYVLWAIGSLADALGFGWNSSGFQVLLKFPALLADAAITVLLFVRLRPQSSRLAWIAALSFLLNPALIIDSTVWGQTDSILAMLLLLALFLLHERQIELGWAIATLAVLMKPQALLLVPLLVLQPRGWWRGPRPLAAALAVVATVFVVAEPFRADRPWSWLIDLYAGTTGYYAETSVNAMNLPALLFGMRAGDGQIMAGLSLQTWGFVAGLLAGLPFLVTWLRRPQPSQQVHLLAAAALVAFCCLTRMHERYLYPFFPFAALLGPVGTVGVIYWVLSALFLTNEWVVYLEQAQASAGPVWLWSSVAVATLAAIPAWLFVGWRGARDPAGMLPASGALDTPWTPPVAPRGSAHPKPAARPAAALPEALAPRWTAMEIAACGLLTLVALGLRLWEIGVPPEIVFDEVYFVEQARNYLIGKDFLDPHPPFAKLMIGLGQWLLGDTPTGWRISNAISGTALVPLFWILARRLFRRRVAAGFAGLFIAIDGLLLVDSRIAVIDIHYVTWAVAAYVLTLGLIRDRAYQVRSRLIAVGVTIGISVGAKLYIPFFSFLLVIGTVAWCGLAEARRCRTPAVSYLRRPVLLIGWSAFAAYASTFLPHFLWGWWSSPFDFVRYIAIEVPNYQAAVADATHPYSSNWWTWPLLLRPIWYFWKDPGPAPGLVVGIWGSGNPVFWWTSVPALMLAAWHAVRERRFDLGFVAAGWALHLAPWVPIGRTLFLYHYLPSLLFALLALAWLLDRFWAGDGSPGERTLIGATLALSLLPVAGAVAQPWGVYAVGVALLVFAILTLRSPLAAVVLNRPMVVLWTVVAIALSWYFMPVWMGTPIPRGEWEARMWHTNSAILSWI